MPNVSNMSIINLSCYPVIAPTAVLCKDEVSSKFKVPSTALSKSNWPHTKSRLIGDRRLSAYQITMRNKSCSIVFIYMVSFLCEN